MVIKFLFNSRSKSSLEYLFINCKLFKEYKFHIVYFVFIIIYCVIKKYIILSLKIDYIY